MKAEFQVVEEKLVSGQRVLFQVEGKCYTGVIHEVFSQGTLFDIRSKDAPRFINQVKRSDILALRLTEGAESSACTGFRWNYGRRSQVTHAHLVHLVYGEYADWCGFCQKEDGKSEAQKERQQTRENGKYAQYVLCDYCGKKLAHHAALVIPEDGEDPANGVLEVHEGCAPKYLAEIKN